MWNFGETAKLSPKSRTTGCPNRYLHGLPTYRTAPTVLPLTAQTSGQEAALRVSFCCVLTKTNGTPHTFERDNGRKAQEALATLLSVELQKMRSNHTLDLIAATKARYLAGSKATEACQTAHKSGVEKRASVSNRNPTTGHRRRRKQRNVDIERVHVWSPRGIVRER